VEVDKQGQEVEQEQQWERKRKFERVQMVRQLLYRWCERQRIMRVEEEDRG